MKKIFLILLFIILSAIDCSAETPDRETNEEFTIVIMSIGNPIMTVNDMEVEIDKGYGTSPVIQNGHTMVPVRALMEQMGSKVEWDKTTQIVSIYSDNNVIELKINSELVYINGEEYTLDTPPVIINSRTLLPVRFVSEGFGFNVDWNEVLHQIIITSGEIDKINSENNTISEREGQENNMIDINLKIGNSDFSAKLYNNETTRQFIKDFPVTYNMSELHVNEKYYYMSGSFPTNSERPSIINKGEIMLYSNDCLVVFYDTFPNSYTYTRLGYIENVENLEKALGEAEVNVTFELIQ